MLISLVVPSYNEEEAMPLFYKEAARVAAGMERSHGAEFEFIFVDDGSKDKTLQVARRLHDQDPRVRYVSFSRNFGKEAAIYAGLKAAKGDYVATLDADLQDPPPCCPKCWTPAHRRLRLRRHPPHHPPGGTAGAQLVRPQVLPDHQPPVRHRDRGRRPGLPAHEPQDGGRRAGHGRVQPFSKGIFSWVGFSTKWFDYENVERVAGKTKWNFWGLFKYSIEGIVGFSTAPLVMAAGAGVVFCLAAFVGILFVVVRR